MARSALIIKLAAIGDVVMALPMVSAIKALDADTRITWLCGRSTAPLVRCAEGVSEVIVVDEAAMLAGSPAAKVSAVLGAWRSTFLRSFDAIYVAHSDLRYQLLTWAMSTKLKRGLDVSKRSRGIVSGRTHSDEYVRLVTGFDDSRAKTYPPPHVRFDLPEGIERRIREFNSDKRPLIGLTPGGARNVARENPLRRWPLERYGSLARELHRRGFRIVLTGNRTDGWVRNAFWEHPVLDLIGATDVPSLGAVLERCAAVVAHDSGPLHLARLVGTPVVALLGPTPPSMFFRPDPRTTVLWPGGSLPCAPCYDGTEFAACSNNVCMQMIKCDEVLRQVCALASHCEEGHRFEQAHSPQHPAVEPTHSDPALPR